VLIVEFLSTEATMIEIIYSKTFTNA
jgi:hypothetical protein